MDSSSVEFIVEFFRRNNFAKAEAALVSELSCRPELNAVFQRNEAYGLEPWSKSNNVAHLSDELQKEHFTGTDILKGNASSYQKDTIASEEERKGKHTGGFNKTRLMVKDQIDEVGRALYVRASQGVHDQSSVSSGYALTLGNQKDDFPPLPPLRLKSEETSLIKNWEEKIKHDEPTVKLMSGENSFHIGSFLDVPFGQDTSASVAKPTVRSRWLSISQGISEDNSNLVSGFATSGDGLNDMVDYPNEYWDSDEYTDDDDVGYRRQPIEDETWFLAHEIDYPSDIERGTGSASAPDEQEKSPVKEEEDALSFAEDDSYFSGENFIEGRNLYQSGPVDNIAGLTFTEVYREMNENNLSPQFDRRKEDLNLTSSEPVWQGFGAQSNEVAILVDTDMANDCKSSLERRCPEKVQNGSARSIGVRISSEAVDFDCAREKMFLSCQTSQSEPNIEYFHDNDIQASSSKHSEQDSNKKHIDNFSSDIHRSKDSCTWPRVNDKGVLTCKKHQTDAGFSFASPVEDGLLDQSASGSQSWGNYSNTVISYQDRLQIDNFSSDSHISKDRCIWPRENEKGVLPCIKLQKDSGFSFSSPVEDEQLDQSTSGSQSWGNYSNTVISYQDAYLNDLKGNTDVHGIVRPKSTDSSPIHIAEINPVEIKSENPPSTLYGYTEIELIDQEAERRDRVREDDQAALMDDEEAVAVQEQARQIQAQEDEFETFNLKIIHRKNRTGFEEDNFFNVELNSVIAGRYHVTEYLGSAAFSKAIQAHDLQTGMDVCVKIIKNNKEFLDQSLDEIKLLKFVNKNDPADEHHLLRLYDYFYYREHLLIVCELLKANLYEFHKFNRESGGEIYFTMPRLQSIAIQCLEALRFLHGIGLIHCDLKPENILVKSYSRCEVKVIDLGSSCFETDHLCSYVQSRSYRAPEVILGVPYGTKIDIWSLGCILAELCNGNVIFQNDSSATLLARIIGIISPIDRGALAKGKDTYKYFTKSFMLYERNQETNRLEYLLPKKSSLMHRLPMGDRGFIEFVAYLLETNPSKRPSASEALKHPWLSPL